MKKTIWKYELTPGKLSIEMPKDAEILSVQMQNDIPCVWALVNPENKVKEKVIEIFGTGHEMHCDGISRKFIGTFQMHGGLLVFHLFERL
jgi:hypothetical protein